MGYTLSLFRSLVSRGIDVHVVYWDNKKLTPYYPDAIENVLFYRRSDFNKYRLEVLFNKINPKIVYISGWQDLSYLILARHFKKCGSVVVCGFDDQWFGTARQQFASFLAQFGFFKIFFSVAWVSGIYQYEYARKLGFKKNEIIYNLLSCDSKFLHANNLRKLRLSDDRSYPRSFLYIGRFSEEKGVDLLLQAWQLIDNSDRSNWELKLIGCDPDVVDQLNEKFKDFKIKFISYQTEMNIIISEIIEAGCAIIPSRREAWSVSAHEFAASGVPLILSSSVGSNPHFFINGFNGYSFVSGRIDSLVCAILRIISTSDNELNEFSFNSSLLGGTIITNFSVASLLSLDVD